MKFYTGIDVNGQITYNNNPQNGYLLTTDGAGVVSWTASLATASGDRLGGIKIGSGISVANDGTISVSGGGGGSTYTAGIGLTLSGGTFSVKNLYSKTYYVSDVIGSDSNDGLSEFSPYKTIWKARDMAVFGDNVQILAATYSYVNTSATGYPWNGSTNNARVNLWKNGVQYYFRPGAKIVMWTDSGSNNLKLFQPNTTEPSGASTFSTCACLGYLEIDAINNGGNLNIFDGNESFSTGVGAGYDFVLEAKRITCPSGGTIISSIRVPNSTTSHGYATFTMRVDHFYFKWDSATYPSLNAGACAIIGLRGGMANYTIINMEIKNLINIPGGNQSYPLISYRAVNTSGYLEANDNMLILNFKVNQMVLREAYLLHTNHHFSGGTSWATHRMNFHVDMCIFSGIVFATLQAPNFRVNITGNYYCSGTNHDYSTTLPTFNCRFVPAVPNFGCLILMYDSTNDAYGTDYAMFTFRGNYYANNPTKSLAYVSSGHRLHFDGNVYFNNQTQQWYTGNLFVLGYPASAALEDALVFRGKVHGAADFGARGGFAGTLIAYYSSLCWATIDSAYILSDLNSRLFSGGTGQLRLQNSKILLNSNSAPTIVANGTTVLIENTVINNSGTASIFSSNSSSGSLTLIASSLQSTGLSASPVLNYEGVNSNVIVENSVISSTRDTVIFSAAAGNARFTNSNVTAHTDRFAAFMPTGTNLVFENSRLSKSGTASFVDLRADGHVHLRNVSMLSASASGPAISFPAGVSASVTVDNTLFLSTVDTPFYGGFTGSLRISNSRITTNASLASVISAENTLVTVDNSTFRNTGTSSVFSNTSLVSGRLQIVNSSVLKTGAGVIPVVDYPGTTVSAFGTVFNSQPVHVGFEGTYSVATFLM